MSTYNFDKTTRIGDYEVNLCTDELYGCFEDVEDGGEGGLWFELNDDGVLSLIDYDGYYDLPKEVRQALTDFGCDITWVTQYDE
jgi:hypothetical protein